MSLIDVYRADLHDVVFVGGMNLTQKLDTRQRAGTKRVDALQWDEEEDELVVTHQGEVGRMPHTGVKIYFTVDDNPNEAKVVEKSPHKDQKMPDIGKAQVSTPQSHVFAGPGAGKVGK